MGPHPTHLEKQAIQTHCGWSICFADSLGYIPGWCLTLPYILPHAWLTYLPGASPSLVAGGRAIWATTTTRSVALLCMYDARMERFVASPYLSRDALALLSSPPYIRRHLPIVQTPKTALPTPPRCGRNMTVCDAVGGNNILNCVMTALHSSRIQRHARRHTAAS